MFSSALKSFSSNITSNYEISKQPSATSGAWRVFDGKKKSTGAQVSVFVFDRKSLDVQSSGFGARASTTSVRKAQDEVVDRLKREASRLARLRHPSILQLVEPVEDTRSGGLMFATEPVTASLAGLLSEKDDQEHGGGGRRPSRFVVEESDGSRRRRDLEIDELEIQKGLLQVAKGLEFLHRDAGLVHGNLTPEAIWINAKSDWKIAGLSFTGVPDGADGPQATAMPSISLSEALYHDARIPRWVQLNLDYASPDFVLDNNINFLADIFSLGLLIVALYNFPHSSPIQTHGNLATYKKLFGSLSTTPSSSNDFLSTRPLPRELSQTLPQLLARRPAGRMTAGEFQQSAYFDNILVNTIRFLDALPTKTPGEKAQFMRGLRRVMPQFPASVLGKKILTVLLEEMKDKELLALILQNIFAIIKAIPSGRRVFPEKVLPRFREVFLSKSKSDEKDANKEAGLMVVLENISLVGENCSGKEFKDDVLPFILLGIESTTHSLVDASLQSVSAILPVLDYSTVKQDLFPAVANACSKTSSLGIKVRALEALVVLCGGTTMQPSASADDLSGIIGEATSKTPSGTALDKFTVQEKVVPLLQAIKTKEPAVMMAALGVFQQVGKVADTEFLAVEVLPTLWSFSLGPLLNLEQFKAFMELIKRLSSKIEHEQTKKLQELSANGRSSASQGVDSPTQPTNANRINGTGSPEDDFTRLVLGNKPHMSTGNPAASFAQPQPQTAPLPQQPSFSWSTTDTTNKPAPGISSFAPLQPSQPVSRSITPDMTMSSFPILRPASATGPNPRGPSQAAMPASNNPNLTSPPPFARVNSLQSLAQQQSSSAPPPLSNTFSVAAPPSNPWAVQSPTQGNFNPLIAPPPANRLQQPPVYGSGLAINAFSPPVQQSTSPPNEQQPKQGLDKYQSLL